VRARLFGINDAYGEVPLLHADVEDPASLRAIAESARVVISTVGPYIVYGEPLVAACAAVGTDYVDLTGESEFVDLMWLRYHDQAQLSGARLIHCCGFDSIPHDLGAFFTVQHLPEDTPLSVNGFVSTGATISGGTYRTAINAFGRLRQAARSAADRRRLEPRPRDRRTRGIVGRPHRDADAGGWVVPLPTIDPQIVLRSARALPRYGPDFAYGHFLVQKRLANLAALAGGAGAAIALAQLPPTRRLLLSLRSPGEGPTLEQRERSWFRVRFVGEGGGQRVVTEVSGGDPGYGETAKMLGESALCLIHDELPELTGQLTTAAAMGQPLLDRLQRAGIAFRVAG
jgi:saccharopine dehydrogenase (NAD+, L-glutamate forming)